jgi:hypothetical protein
VIFDFFENGNQIPSRDLGNRRSNAPGKWSWYACSAARKPPAASKRYDEKSAQALPGKRAVSGDRARSKTTYS